MKKIHIWILTLYVLLALIVLPCYAEEVIASGTCGPDLEWKIINDQLIISGNGPMDNFTEGGAPWHAYRSGLKSLIIEEGVTSVGQYAFSGYTMIDSVTIPASMTEINFHAFPAIEEVHTTDLSAWCRISFIGPFANPLFGKLYLNGKGLTEITIPSDITQLRPEVFSGAYQMINVVIPANVQSIGDQAFYDCGALEAVVFLGDAPEMLEYSFIFRYDECTIYYPEGNETWTKSIMNDHGGVLTWIPYEYEEGFFFVKQPENKKAYSGDLVELHCVAVGEGQLSYQWQFLPAGGTEWKDVYSIYGESAAALLHLYASEDTKGSYKCIVSDEFGNTIQSDEVDITLKSTKCIDYSRELVDNSFRYLNEFYVETCPDMAFSNLYGTEKDNKVLQDLADVISYGLETDQEKADAVCRWIRRNISTEAYSVYPIDAFYERKGECLGCAELMQDLLRKMGIPAVVGDGWRGDMELMETQTLFNLPGHAWCFAYLDGQWVMYDPLWGEDGITDRDYMAKWYYMVSVEWIYPAFKYGNMPPMDRISIPSYVDGTFAILDGDGQIISDPTMNGVGMIVNNLQNEFKCRREDNKHEWVLVDAESNDDFENGEIIRGGWIHHAFSEYDYGYVFENGLAANNGVLKKDGTNYYFEVGIGKELKIPLDQQTIWNGYLAIPVGYIGQCLWPSHLTYRSSDEYTVTWSSRDPSVATVDSNGCVSALSVGEVLISIDVVRKVDNAYITHDSFWLTIYENARIVDYSDNFTGHEHVYTEILREPSCNWEGYSIFTCVYDDCADSYLANYSAKVDHSFTNYVSNNDSTCTEDGTKTAICDNCDATDTVADPGSAKGHKWSQWKESKPSTGASEGEEKRTCSLCKKEEKRAIPKLENPFTDVPSNMYYLDPVLWAVSKGITTGTEPGKFEPEESCTRGQIVTFLWRAAGQPKPTSTKNPFKDVPKNMYYYNAVLWAVEMGITNGVDATHFGPDEKCTRGQVATFLWRYLKEPKPASGKNPFKDVPKNMYYYNPVLWAVEAGVTNGTDPGKFSPEDSCTRGQIVTFLYRALAE